MLYKQTISTFLYETLEHLMKLESLQGFRLVGGTSLALQLGHRTSIDIDLFCEDYPIDKLILEELRLFYPKVEIRSSSLHVTMFLPVNNNEELKVDFMSTDKFIRPIILKNGLRLAHVEEIAAMKLEAITTRKEKKDYWDISVLLKKYSVAQLIEFYKERYPWNDIREVVEHLGLAENCNKQPDPIVMDSSDWNGVKASIREGLQVFLNRELRN